MFDSQGEGAHSDAGLKSLRGIDEATGGQDLLTIRVETMDAEIIEKDGFRELALQSTNDFMRAGHTRIGQVVSAVGGVVIREVETGSNKIVEVRGGEQSLAGPGLGVEQPGQQILA